MGYYAQNTLVRIHQHMRLATIFGGKEALPMDGTGAFPVAATHHLRSRFNSSLAYPTTKLAEPMNWSKTKSDGTARKSRRT